MLLLLLLLMMMMMMMTTTGQHAEKILSSRFTTNGKDCQNCSVLYTIRSTQNKMRYSIPFCC